MSYHPLMGISLFVGAIVIAFYLGVRTVMKRRAAARDIRKLNVDAGAPDAPWIDSNKEKQEEG